MIPASIRRRLIAAGVALLGGSAAHAQPFPEWMRVERPLRPDVAVQQFLVMKAGPGRDFARLAPAQRFPYGSESVFLAGGREDAEWWFFAKTGALAPSSAYYLSEPSRTHYVVVIQPYCDGSTCPELLQRIARIRAPKPRPGADPQLRREWQAVVAQEPCDPLKPIRVLQPRRPVAGVRKGLDGTVRVRALHNRCGEVRDVQLMGTSGDQGLDRRAVIIVSGWRIAARPSNTSGWSIETVRFDLVPPRPAPDASVKPARR